MKFTDGYWQIRPGLTRLRPAGVESVDAGERELTVFAPAKKITDRGDTLNQPLFTITFTSPAPDVIGVRIEHHVGGVPARPSFALSQGDEHPVKVEVDPQTARLTTGDLTVVVALDGPWNVTFERDGRYLTGSDARSVGLLTDPEGRRFLHEQLALGVGETVYGLGERFGPLVKNGQVVDIWNADGGTSSEQAYKNVPFYLSSAGYGVFVDSPGHVSFEVGSEVVSRNQFSVEDEILQYYVIGGPEPKDVLRRYTALTGRPARVPAWSMGLWLSTSFTTDYNEETTSGFVDGMAERDLPLSVFHFDCFWMRQFHWCDFAWDPEAFPDPAAMLARLKARGLRISLWINPYIAQRSALFEEGRKLGYLLRRPDGSVWQWDMWQAGMAIVDFTNPDATAWFRGKLQALIDMGVDCFKTDFGERIPTDVVWFDGSDPERMHNYYPHLYNRAVFDLLEQNRGEGDAVLFARSATAGGQQFPVHWGGDCESSFEAMAESLRGGLSLASSGFGYWSHDIGGFEGTPDAAVFKRWVPFGLLSSHSRLHGSGSYRVPWAFDEEAVQVLRAFTKLKLALMPYLVTVATEAHEQGTPMMRPMLLEFPNDPAVAYLERQYMLGPDILVAPVMSRSGEVRFYLPEGTWTHLLSGEQVEGSRWITQTYGFDSLPVFVRQGAVLAFGSVDDRPEYDWANDVELRWYHPTEGDTARVTLPGPDGTPAAVLDLTYTAGQAHTSVIEGTPTHTITVIP
ncbi:alpha-xylosidase [Kribbella deserti]|uniref:Alpha-xylosidase n=1 Tax=Kribbella deserti TaxID=1926257 RepID=A0ABV6QHR8_9ACTN